MRERDYGLGASSLRGMLAASGVTPLLGMGMSTGSKNCVAWKVEKAVCYFVHTEQVTTDSPRSQPMEICLIRQVAQLFRKLKAY